MDENLYSNPSLHQSFSLCFALCSSDGVS